MQPPPRPAPPGACGPPPTSGGPNAYRRTRPHKHGAVATAPSPAPPSQPMTDPFAFGRQAPPLLPLGSQAPPTNSSSLPMQAPSLAGFLQTAPPQGPPFGAQAAAAAAVCPPPAVFTPHPGPSGQPPAPNPPPAEPGYFSSQEPMPYIAQLPNPVPSFSSSQLQPLSAASTPPVQSTPLFQPTSPTPPHLVPDRGSRPPSVQNYFQPTSDTPQPFHATLQSQAPPPGPLPHHAPPQTHAHSRAHAAMLNTSGPPVSQQQNSLFSTQNYFSQTGGASDPWFSHGPQDPSQDACPVPCNVTPGDPGTVSMFFQGNDVENKETLSGEGRLNGVSHPPHTGVATEAPYLNDSGNIRASTGPCDTVENLECVPNQEVLPSEPPPSHAYEAGPNLEMPDSALRPPSVSSSYSNVSHSSGPTLHSSSHQARRHQGIIGTFIQQESPRPPDPAASHPSTTGYFEQIDSAPALELSPIFPTPSPPKPVGVFQPSANSSFEPVRSHGVGVRPAEVDQARMVMEKIGADGLPGNLEQPPDNMETICFPGGQDRRPSSRAQGSRRPCDSPATTLWAQSDPTSLGANILLAPAAPPLAATFAPARRASAEVIQPPEDGPLDLHPPRVHAQPHSENLENPPDSLPQASLGYASLLVATPPVEALNQPVLIAPPSSNYSVISPQSPVHTANQTSPTKTTSPVRPLAQTPVANQLPQSSLSNQPLPLFSQTPVSFPPPSCQSPLNLAVEAKDALPAVKSAHPPLFRAQSLKGDGQAVPPPNPQIPSSDSATNQNPPSNYELLDFSMHQPQIPNLPALPPGPVNNTPGFYLQVTKDSQQGGRADTEPLLQPQNANAPRPPSSQVTSEPPVPLHPAHPAAVQRLPPSQTPPTSKPAQPPESAPSPAAGYSPKPGNPAAPHDPQRPPSVTGGYAPPPMPSGPGYGAYYPEYQDGRHPYPPQYPVMDPRAQNYYQEDPYRRADPRYSRYDGPNPGYRDTERQPERPSSRTKQRSTVPPRAPRAWQWLPHACIEPKVCLRIQHSQPDCAAVLSRLFSVGIASRREGYDDPWRYYPGYDSRFDDDYRARDPYADDFDRRSVHSEQSARSVHSAHSRRSSFSSRSQQSQVYRSQPDLVAAGYDSTVPVDYSYGQYPDQSNTHNYSQYNATDTTWTAPEQPPPRPVTPEKYSVPHCCARFGPAGQLILVQPNLPSAGQPALVELHSLEVIMQDSPEQSDLRAFPGPLVKEETHKVDVIKFAQNKAQECMRNDGLIDKDSACLIWEFIMLLCRQNGTVVGTDLADLLLKEHRSVWLPGKSPNEANLIDFTNEALERPEEEESGPLSLLSDTVMSVPENVGKETERFRELLLFGRKKDALESAMKNGLWGHALLLASKMDSRTHARVMTRFANSLPINDPLQTVYQLMSGRMPAAATCCGDDKWGDWRPHLAMVLSNLTHILDLDTRTISTMGDTLASKGLMDAAHFCYLMAQVGFGVFTKKSTKMVLIGSNHSLPFVKFCTTEAIQRTEAYEYAQSLGSPPLSLHNFQVFKFIYACWLAEAGLCAQAFHYCEVISHALLTLPDYHSPVFIGQLIQMSARLRFFDPQLKEKPEQELFQEPDWLLQLRQLNNKIKVCVRGAMVQVMKRSVCLCVCVSCALFFYSNSCSFLCIFNGGALDRSVGRRSRTVSESSTHSAGRERSNSMANQSSPPPPPIPEAPPQEVPKKTKSDSPKKGKNEAHLPDDKNKSIVWDEQKQRWVNLDEPEEENKPPPPPPTMFPKLPTGAPALGVGPGMTGPPGRPGAGPSVNMFSRKAGTKSRYVDVLNPGRGDCKPAPAVAPPADLFAPLAPMTLPANLFVPTAGIGFSLSLSLSPSLSLPLSLICVLLYYLSPPLCLLSNSPTGTVMFFLLRPMTLLACVRTCPRKCMHVTSARTLISHRSG
uniref:Protein transport protein sec16 n=1 Tax=Electrophorus electricus TaxID=8005 RepID=A0A4W4E7R3_ELEEL